MQTLLQKLAHTKTIKRAWNVVRRNRGVAPGIDQVTVDLFEQTKSVHITKIVKQLKNSSYEFQPSRRKAIPKSGGKGTRNIHIFTIRDKIVQQAIQTLFISNNKKNALFPEVYNSVGIAYIPNTNGVKKSVKKVKEFYNQGYVYLSTLDIKDFFDNIPGDDLYKRIIENLPDDTINPLIKQTINQKVYIDDTPDLVSSVLQGSVLAPLYSNIFLSEFDKEIEDSEILMIRYADDIAVFSKSSEEAVYKKKLVRKILKTTTGLDFYADDHPKKASKDRCLNSYATFLGIRYSRNPKGILSIQPSREKVKSQKSKIDEFYSDEVYSIAENILRINHSIKSWYSHYVTCGCHKSPMRLAATEIFDHYQGSTIFILKKYKIILNKKLSKEQLYQLGVLKPDSLNSKKKK